MISRAIISIIAFMLGIVASQYLDLHLFEKPQRFSNMSRQQLLTQINNHLGADRTGEWAFSLHVRAISGGFKLCTMTPPNKLSVLTDPAFWDAYRKRNSDTEKKMAEIYMKNVSDQFAPLSDDELREILAWLYSKTGQKYVKTFEDVKDSYRVLDQAKRTEVFQDVAKFLEQYKPELGKAESLQ